MSKAITKIKRRISKSYVLVYTAAFAVCALLVFSPFILGNKSLVWNPDGTAQHYTAFVYLGNYLREFAANLLHGRFIIPQWDFSIGLGADILTTLHYYSFGDPLDLLSVFIPAKFASVGYSLVMILRYYLAGLAFVALCKYKRLSRFGTASGAMMYIFCSYSLYMAVRHPSFVNPFIYLPLIVLGIEKLFKTKKPYLFIVMIFVSAVSSFYYFYVISLFTVLYIFVRLFFEYKEHFFKNSFFAFLQFGGSYLLGVLMASAVFIPVVSVFLGSARSGVEYEMSALYNLDYYKNFITAFSGTMPVFGSTYLGFTILGWVGVIMLFLRRRKNTFLKTMFIILTFMLMLPVFCKITNGFSYVANRWTWAYGLLIAYIFADRFHALKHIKIKQAICVLAGSILFIATMIRFTSPRYEINYFNAALFVLFGFGCVVYSLLRKKSEWKNGLKIAFKYLVLIFTIGSVFVNSFYIYNEKRGSFVSGFLTNEIATEYAADNSFKNILDVQNTDSAIERYETPRLDLADYNNTLITGAHGTAGYFSLTDGLMNEFQKETGIILNNFSLLESPDCDPFVQLIENVKYYASANVSDKNYGIGSETLTTVKSIVRPNSKELQVHENKNYIPFGFTYKNVISENDYQALSAVEKRTSFANALTINGTDEFVNTNASELPKNVKYVDCEIQPTQGVLLKGNKIYVKEDSAKLTVRLKEKTPENTQVYCLINGLHYIPMTNNELRKVFEAGEEISLDRPLMSKLRMNLPKNKWGSVYANGKTYGFNMVTPENDYYSAITDYTANFGYSKGGINEIKLTLGAGLYTLDSMQIAAVDMSGFEESRNALAQDTLTNLKVETNKITGAISASDDEFLYLSIPYSKYWTARIDGEKAELYRADTAFSAIRLDKGEHTVELNYSNTAVKYSAALSAVGVLGFAAVILYNEKFKKRKNT